MLSRASSDALSQLSWDMGSCYCAYKIYVWSCAKRLVMCSPSVCTVYMSYVTHDTNPTLATLRSSSSLFALHIFNQNRDAPRQRTSHCVAYIYSVYIKSFFAIYPHGSSCSKNTQFLQLQQSFSNLAARELDYPSTALVPRHMYPLRYKIESAVDQFRHR